MVILGNEQLNVNLNGDSSAVLGILARLCVGEQVEASAVTALSTPLLKAILSVDHRASLPPDPRDAEIDRLQEQLARETTLNDQLLAENEELRREYKIAARAELNGGGAVCVELVKAWHQSTEVNADTGERVVSFTGVGNVTGRTADTASSWAHWLSEERDILGAIRIEPLDFKPDERGILRATRSKAWIAPALSEEDAQGRLLIATREDPNRRKRGRPKGSPNRPRCPKCGSTDLTHVCNACGTTWQDPPDEEAAPEQTCPDENIISSGQDSPELKKSLFRPNYFSTKGEFTESSDSCSADGCGQPAELTCPDGARYCHKHVWVGEGRAKRNAMLFPDEQNINISAREAPP